MNTRRTPIKVRRIAPLLFIMLSFAVMLSLSACGGRNDEVHVTHAGALLIVQDKSPEDDLLWITVQSPFDHNTPEQETWKLHIEDRNTWNLIEPDPMYVINFTYDSRKILNAEGRIEGELNTIDRGWDDEEEQKTDEGTY